MTTTFGEVTAYKIANRHPDGKITSFVQTQFVYEIGKEYGSDIEHLGGAPYIPNFREGEGLWFWAYDSVDLAVDRFDRADAISAPELIVFNAHLEWIVLECLMSGKIHLHNDGTISSSHCTAVRVERSLGRLAKVDVSEYQDEISDALYSQADKWSLSTFDWKPWELKAVGGN